MPSVAMGFLQIRQGFTVCLLEGGNPTNIQVRQLCPKGKEIMELGKFSNRGYDRGCPAWKERLWFAVKCLFFLTPWPWPSALRVWLLRCFGAKVGKRVVVRSRVNITFPWRLEVGDDVWIGEEVVIVSIAPVFIDSNVCLSQRVFLSAGSHDFRSPSFDLITKPILVARESWIGAQAFIAMGVKIGPGSMVCAGSIVLHDVPPQTKVMGNPATIVG
jgi:putative colanic acid biosynthesis acetyltransferase WcaF